MPEQFVDVLPGFLRAHPQDAVITKLLVDDLEFQFTFDERPCRIPTDRNGNPCFGGELVTEEALLRRLGLVGTTGWRWKAKQTIFGVLDFDALNHGDGHDEATLLRVVEALRRVGYAWVRHSKGGFGLHGIIPCRPMVAATGKAHTLNVNAIIDRVCADADFDFRKFLCSNQVGFFWTPDDLAPNAFKLLVEPTCEPPEIETPKPPAIAPKSDCEFSAEHRADIAVMSAAGYAAVIADGKLLAHSKGFEFLCPASGRDCGYSSKSPGRHPAEPNSFAYPIDDGGWAVTRFGVGPEKEADCFSANSMGFATARIPARPDKEMLAMTGVDSLPDAKADAKPNAKPNPAEQMLSIVSANYELCHTSERIPVVVSNDDGKRRTFILPDNEFEGIVAKKLFDRFKIIPKSAQINDAFRLVEAYCLEGPCRPVHTRIGNHDGAVYFDLGDDSLRVVKITGKGWTIEATCPILFNRGPNISPMPTPERGGMVAELRPLLNVTDTDWLWVFAYLLAVLNPHGPFPHLILTGKSGSTKSTLARFIVGLIDSTWDEKREREELFEAPKNSEDLLIYGISSWLLAFDNMGMLPDKLSDALCRLATGGAYITRRLYTNNGLAKMSCQQPTVLTMVEDLVEKADLRTRCVFVALQKLAPESMEGERSLQEKFNSLRPRIMGALFDCVSCALGKFEATRPAPGNRMADMTRWCIAAEPATGLPPGTFANLFTPRVPEKTLDDGLRLLAAEGAKLRPKEIVERLNTLGVTDLPEPTALGMLLGKKRLDGVTISKGGKYWRFSLAE